MNKSKATFVTGHDEQNRLKHKIEWNSLIKEQFSEMPGAGC